MKYLRVLQEIGSMVGDPTLKGSNKDLYKIAFINAISTLIKEDKFSEDDIPGFIKPANIDFAGAGDTEDINVLVYLKILGFFLPPGTDKDCIVTFKEGEDLNKISAIETLQPTANDLFIYKVGNILYGVTGATPVFTLGTDIVIMKYIEDISGKLWLDSTDLQDATAFLMTTAFMRAAIQLAGSSLSSEAKQ